MSLMKINKLLVAIGVIVFFGINLEAQNLLDILEKEQKDSTGYVTPAFKMTRIAVGHSTEVRSAGILEVFASNRFWDRPTESSQSFGADKMSTRFALEYGVTDNLSAGVGATTFDRLFDGYLKYRLMSQQKGANARPLNITLFQGGSYNSSAIPNPIINDDFSNRLSFTTQLLISRKISSKFSLQLSPTYVYKGLIISKNDSRNFFALGFGARYKVGPHVSIVSEYYKTFNPIEPGDIYGSADTYGPFALGVNWELGDVLIQLMLTNALNMVEDKFIVETPNNFNFRSPNLNFGFNATYVIHFKNKLKK